MVLHTSSHKLPRNCCPTNTTLVFDIDMVLLKAPIVSAVSANVGRITKALFNIPLMYQVLRLTYHKASGQAYINLFNQKAPKLARMVERIMYTKEPMKGMEQILKSLKAQNYTLTIASNMSAEDFSYYKEKYHSLFCHFDYSKVIKHDILGFPLVNKKPTTSFFKDLKNELACNGLLKDFLVFIDDKKRNINASKKEGLYGIRFKNQYQMHRELAKLGIALSH